MRGMTKAALMLLAVGMVAMALWLAATRWHPATSRYALQGVDLAPDPGPLDWGSVHAAGADFAYLVATVGANRRDAAFEANWVALPEAGMRRGAVHVYSLCQSAIDQADAFNTFVPRADDALPAALDLSFQNDCTTRPARAALLADLARFLKMVEAHTGKPLLLRITKPVERAYGLTRALRRPVWAIGNGIAPSYAARPWRLWRASDIRRIDGYDGAINWDVVAP